MSAVKVWSAGDLPIRGTAAHSDNSTWVEAELKDVRDQAVIALLIKTCKLNDVEPLGYLADVLTRIVNGHPNSQIDDLLPWAYIRAPALKAVAGTPVIRFVAGKSTDARSKIGTAPDAQSGMR